MSREHALLQGEAITAYLAAKPHKTIESIPLAEDISGKYAVKGYGALTRQLEDPQTPPENIAKLRQERAKLYMAAVHNIDVYVAGPVREQAGELPPPPTLPPEIPPKNIVDRVGRAMKKLGGNIKQQWDNFVPFAKENKKAAKTGVAVGFLAGLAIVTGVHAGTELTFKAFEMIGMSNNTLHWMLGIPINIAGSWYLNREFIKKVRSSWASDLANKHFREKRNLTDSAVLTQREQENLNLDTKGMFASIVLGDIAGKIAGSILPITAILDRMGDSLHALREFLTGNKLPDLEVPQVSVELPDAQTPPTTSLKPGEVLPAQGEIGITGSSPHLDVTTTVEHVVTGNDEMLTKILVEHGLQPYSTDYIRMLSANKDTFADMIKEVFPDGRVKVLVDVAKNDWDFVSVDQAVKNLNEVIEAGYPDASKLSPEAYRAALTKMFNAVRYLLPGTVLDIPTP